MFSSCQTSDAMSTVSSSTIQKPSPSKSYTVTAFAEPMGLFSGLELVLNACVACVPALSSLTFLGERHSFAQCPCLPQLWHLPLQHFHLSPSEPVTARASSVVSFFPPWPVCLHVRRLFNQSASSLIWLMRASMLIADALWTIRAEERMCDMNVASVTAATLDLKS